MCHVRAGANTSVGRVSRLLKEASDEKSKQIEAVTETGRVPFGPHAVFAQAAGFGMSQV